MATKQVYTPNFNARAKSGWCLKYVDDAGRAPKRTPTADAARYVEQNAHRLKTGTPPVGIWVVGFLKLVGASGHVFFMKYKGRGVYEIRDSEVRIGHHEGPYTSIAQVLSWFSRYRPTYAGYSFQCDGRVYAETYTAPKPSGKTYRVVKSVKGYYNSVNAKAHKSPVNTVAAATYSVFNEADGMINVTKKPGVPGSWINPADNKTAVSRATYYIVKRGDTLGKIASKFKTTWQKLYAKPDNRKVIGRNPNVIKPGEKIDVGK